MSRIREIAQDGRVQAALADLSAQVDDVMATAVTIQQIPAPTFAEAARAAYVQSQFEAIGLRDAAQDGLHNVYGRIPAASPTHPPVILSAHLDTVFPAETDLSVREDGRFIYGPGLADNSVGVAGLLHLAQTLIKHKIPLQSDLWVVANVGEEGLGDLRGMRAVFQRFGQDALYIVIEGGLYGQISHQAIGVRRFRVEIETEGGHSWGNFGQPSAIHELARLIAKIDRLVVPANPKTTYNAGVIEGGTSINTIAHSASMLLDLRSENAGSLAHLVAAVEALVDAARKRLVRNGSAQAAITMTQIGYRPPGSVPRQSPLVCWAEEALQFVGCTPTHVVSSTDANVPLSQGGTAVCIGLTQSGNAHRPDEFVDPTYLADGLRQLLLLVLAAGRIKPA